MRSLAAPPRLAKLVRDVAAERGRIALMIAAIAASLAAVGGVLGAYAILTREMAVNYLGTRPAAATLELPGGVDAPLVDAVRRLPGVADAERRDVIVARARVGGDWRRLLLFVVDDFRDLRLGRFTPERGAWPPGADELLVERTALPMLETEVGRDVLVRTAHGAERSVRVAGVVHDPGLAPAWQERCGYGYLTRDALARLGEPPVFHELRLAFTGDPRDVGEVEARATAVARWLAAGGHAVSELQVPPPAQHPHQRQMVTILVMLLSFAAMALLLSAILVATSLAALLARQVREIAVMKTLGATGGRIARLYALLVGGVGGAAVLVAAPLGAGASLVLARAISRLLNLTLTDTSIPHWVFAVVAAAGVAVPLAVSALPLSSASRRTIREALDDHGAAADGPGALAAWLPLPLRNALRRPWRTALAVGLLATAGAMAMTAIQVKEGWDANVARVYLTRDYDVEALLALPAPASLASRLGALEGVRTVEAWGYAAAAFTRPGAIDVVRTYPDRGHGSFAAMGIPPETGLIHFPLRAGRWLRPADRGGDAVVLNHVAAAQRPRLRLGDEVWLTLDGRPTRWHLVGVVEEIGSPGVAYVTDTSFAASTATAGQARLLRAATSGRSPAAQAAVMRRIDQALDANGASVQSVLPLAELRTAVGDHVRVLVRMLLAMAAILGVVGALGLASTMGVSVVERTREIAVLKTLGATPGRIQRLLLSEAAAVAAVSYLAGCVLSVPLTLLVDGIVGRLGFLAPLPLVLSPGAALSWLGAGAAVTLLATLLPARRASALVVREALGRT